MRARSTFLAFAVATLVAAGCAAQSSPSAFTPALSGAALPARLPGRIYTVGKSIVVPKGMFPQLDAYGTRRRFSDNQEIVTPNNAAIDYYLEVPGITGPATVQNVAGFFNVSSFTLTPTATGVTLDVTKPYTVQAPLLLSQYLWPVKPLAGALPSGGTNNSFARLEIVFSNSVTLVTIDIGSNSPSALTYVTAYRVGGTTGTDPDETMTLASTLYTYCARELAGGPFTCSTLGPTPTPSPSPTPTPTPTPAPAFNEFAIPTVNSQPLNIAQGPDGALWFTEHGANQIGRVAGDGTISEYAVPTAHGNPIGIARGVFVYGDEWFAEEVGNKLARISTAGTVTNEYPIPSSSSHPAGIVAGPDGHMWFTEQTTGKIGVYNQGTITEYALSNANSTPIAITIGPDQNLWFTEYCGSKIGRITTSGSISEFPVTASSLPYSIVNGPDGALWFTESAAGKIGRMTTAGTLTNEYSIPSANSNPQDITVGSDSALWFTEGGANKLGRITTSGTITEVSIPTANSFPNGIASGPNHSIWFVETTANKIGEYGPISTNEAIPRHRNKPSPSSKRHPPLSP